MSLATLRFWADRFIWTSPRHVGAETSRPAVAILLGGWGDLTLGHEGRTLAGRALVVGPNVKRSIAAEQGFYSFNLDPVHRLSRSLRQACEAAGGVIDLSTRVDAAIGSCVASAIREPMECTQAWRVSESVLCGLFPDAASLGAIDERVDRVAAWLRHHLPNRPQLPELAALCGLSQGRLTHLFSEELGVSIKSYLLAMKMRKAAELFGADHSLTEVAAAMGFSDSAHLSRAFRSYFSVTPSLLVNRALVQLEVCG